MSPQIASDRGLATRSSWLDPSYSIKQTDPEDGWSAAIPAERATGRRATGPESRGLSPSGRVAGGHRFGQGKPAAGRQVRPHAPLQAIPVIIAECCHKPRSRHGGPRRVVREDQYIAGLGPKARSHLPTSRDRYRFACDFPSEAWLRSLTGPQNSGFAHATSFSKRWRIVTMASASRVSAAIRSELERYILDSNR